MKTNSIETRASKLPNLEIFLLNLRYKEGRLVEVEGNKPILLNDAESVWVVYSGLVDVFSVPLQNEEVTGARSHIFRSTTGQALFGIHVDQDHESLGLLVSGTPGTRLLKLKRARLWELAAELEYSELVQAMLEDWVMGLSSAISKEVLPKEYIFLEPNQTVSLNEPQIAIPKRGIVWVRCAEGAVQVLGRPELRWAADHAYLPVSDRTWLQPVGPACLNVIDTAAFTQQNVAWADLERFHQIVFAAAAVNRQQATAAEVQRLQEKDVSERVVMENALLHLTTPLQGSATATLLHDMKDGQDPLLSACQLIGNELGIEIHSHPRASAKQTRDYRLRTIAQASRIQMREVALRDDWWCHDGGPLLAFREGNQQPVALIPVSASRYLLTDPATRTQTRVTAQVAARLSPIGYTFYRPFPNRALTARDLLKLGTLGNRKDLRTVVFLGLGISLLGLLLPLATGVIFNTIIPQGNVASLLQIGAMLLLVSLAAGALQIARGMAVLRVQSKTDASIQAALWDRLLALPIPFFSVYSAGDLGSRAMGVSEIRRMLSGYTISTILNSLFSLVNLILLFYYSPQLAVVAIILVVIAIGFTLVIGALYIRPRRNLERIKNKIWGMTLQLLTGVTKFRIAGAERHAFATWAEGFSNQKRMYYKARMVSNNLAVYNAAYPLIASVVIFAVVALSSQANLSTGDFLAFNLAFIQFFSAWFLLGSVLINILNVIPVYENMQPLLAVQPEVDETKIDPGELSGEIEVNHVSFRYKEKGSLVLKDVSLHVKSGEFAALVGASGSGKSTLLRLLLGFAKPETGGIYYDDQGLADLDLHEVRRQIGVVLQSATLMPGDIFSNIIGSWSNLTLDDAWEAARLAGLADDIKRLPMGMNTIISERGSNISGGQRQRLLIARAIINRPRVLFFDEATSALDNQTQAIVSRSLEDLHATRIVIAHRLSTIIHADRIYVFDSGQIVQTGTYQQLINQPGTFAELARRQTL